MRHVIAFLVFLIIPSTIFAQTNWFEGTFDEAKAAAKKSGKRIFIYTTDKSE